MNTVYQCTSVVTGEAIASATMQQLTSWQLQLQFLRGQSFDGVCAAMSGKTKGAAACIVSQFPKAMFIYIVCPTY